MGHPGSAYVNSSIDVVMMYSNSYTHEHVLRALDDLTIDLQ